VQLNINRILEKNTIYNLLFLTNHIMAADKTGNSCSRSDPLGIAKISSADVQVITEQELAE
jgi:hypothetical protein